MRQVLIGGAVAGLLALGTGCGTEGGATPPGGTADVTGDVGGGEGDAESDTAEADTKAPDPECTTDDDCADSEVGPVCNVEAGACEALPRAWQLGDGDGSPGTVTLTTIFEPQDAFEATDLEFHPTRHELWVVNRPFHVEGVCAESNPFSARCRSLEGTTTIIFEPGTPNQSAEIRVDGNAWHFMRRPPAMAMGVGERWATCGEAATGNFEDNSVQFIGPSLWSSELDEFATDELTYKNGYNGSHYDMLHATPWCMGIAHERDNVYWAFNGHVGALDRYDFHEDHGPGAEDHSDGEIHRYAEGQVARVAGVPSHMEFNDDDQHLYVVDTGNERIIKLDTTSGKKGLPFSPVYEPLADYGKMTGAVVSDVVSAGLLDKPSGLALHDGLLFVSDNATSKLYAFELDGTLVRSLDTGLPTGTLAGLAVGPDDKLYLSDLLTGSVYRVDPK